MVLTVSPDDNPKGSFHHIYHYQVCDMRLFPTTGLGVGRLASITGVPEDIPVFYRSFIHARQKGPTTVIVFSVQLMQLSNDTSVRAAGAGAEEVRYYIALYYPPIRLVPAIFGINFSAIGVKIPRQASKVWRPLSVLHQHHATEPQFTPRWIRYKRT